MSFQKKGKEVAENRQSAPVKARQPGGLSFLERHIAELILEANSGREIAAKLGCHAYILSIHMSRIYSKFNLQDDGLHNRTVQLALRVHEQRAILGIRCPSCDEM